MLTDLACRKAQSGPKDRKLADERGLFLLVRANGSKLWRFKYRIAGKEKQLAIGAYPEIGISQARQARDAARAMLRAEVDPAIERKQRKARTIEVALHSFEPVARAWQASRAKVLDTRYAEQILSRLEENVFKPIGALPLRDITPPMVLDLLRKIEHRGAKEMAHRVRMHVSDVFVWAIASGLADQDPAAMVRKALVPTAGKLRPAVKTIAQASNVLKKTEAMDGAYWATHLASRLLALTAARPGVVRLAERAEFEDLDGNAPIWRVPAAKMKLTRERKRDAAFEFVIPLASQAVAVLHAALSAPGGETWLFPGIADRRKPISDSTLSKHYRQAGFTGVHVPHGWRAAFSTIMNERAAHEDRERDRAIIDLMLAHVPEGVEASYNRAVYMPRRRQLAQAWADMLMRDAPPPTTLIPASS